MEERHAPDSGVLLAGPDGSNPLGFLSALGALRVLDQQWPGRSVALGWTVEAGAWRPVLYATPTPEPDEVVDAVAAGLPDDETLFDPDLVAASEQASPGAKASPKWRDKLRFPRDLYAAHARAFIAEADRTRREPLDYLAAWASDAALDQADGTVVARRTRFDFTAGQQAFIRIARQVRETVGTTALRDALFGPWTYVSGVSLRWDPLDESRQYALQAVDPTDSTRNPILSVPGANLLAVAGLAFFPIIPAGRGAEQPGFDRSSEGRSFRWPIWRPAVGADIVRSLLCMRDLARSPLPWPELRARGIDVVFRSWIVQPSGRYRNFTPAEAL